MYRCPLYTPAQIAMATLFGSVLAGTVLIVINARRLGQRSLAWKAMAGGLAALGISLLAAIQVTESGAIEVALVPNLPFAILIALIAKDTHREEYRKHPPQNAILAARVAIVFVPAPIAMFFAVYYLTR